MFAQQQRHAMTARETNTAHAKLTDLLASRDHWYDGTVASVDSRLRAVDNAMPFVSRVASTDADMLKEVEALRTERARLTALRRDLLQAPAIPARVIPKMASGAIADPKVRRFVAVELREFMADNADAVDDLDELDTRAEQHAELKTIQMPVLEAASVCAGFRMAVNWSARSASKERRKERRNPVVASVGDVPDDALFY